jgi:hypothetical protein
MVDEAHDSVEEARAKAEVFRKKLDDMGWSTSTVGATHRRLS